jgi:hypothetical protein
VIDTEFIKRSVDKRYIVIAIFFVFLFLWFGVRKENISHRCSRRAWDAASKDVSVEDTKYYYDTYYKVCKDSHWF